MEKLKNHSVIGLANDELTEISGGGFWIGVLGAVAVHLALEAYNDWDAHVKAFNNGRASAQK